MSSIFDFEDIMGVKSPLGNWMQDVNAAKASRRLSKSPFSTESSYSRLMFYGGAKKSSDNNTFLNAARNVNKDYPVKASIVEVKRGGQQVVDKINSLSSNTLQSIDFFTHGSENAFHFKRDSKGNMQDLYMNNKLEQEEGATGGWFTSDKNENGADIGEIDYDVFTNAAKIEVHGCNTGMIDSANKGANIAAALSLRMYIAGKKRAVVVGHTTFANPNRFEGEDVPSDYRHGRRRVFHAGTVLFETLQEGRISASTINKYLNDKLGND